MVEGGGLRGCYVEWRGYVCSVQVSVISGCVRWVLGGKL